MKTLILCLVLFLTLSCSNNDANTSSSPQTIMPVLIGKGSLMGSENIPQQNIVISDSANWNLILNSIDLFRLAQFSETTNVDFVNFQLIAVFDKVYPSPTYEFKIVNVVENSTNIVVTVQKTLQQSSVTVIDQKFHIVKIPKSPKPVVFQNIG